MQTQTYQTQGLRVPQLPNTVLFQCRNWEILGVYYTKHGTPYEVQLRSLDQRRELRIIAYALVATRC